MADPTEKPRPDDFEEGGGPVKTFLEHLEDLRWLFINSGVALVVGVIVCLYGTHTLVWILKRPLQRAALIQIGHTQKALVRFGTNDLTSFEVDANRIGSLDLGSNAFVIIHAEPISTGSNILLSLTVEKNPPDREIVSSATDLVYFDPAAPFMASLHLAFYGGVLLAAPFIAYFLAQFVLPALKVKEKKYVLQACIIGAGLF